MKKHLLPLLMAGIFVGAVVSSCSKEHPDSGAPGSPAGTLVGDDEAANAELANLRLSSVDDFVYTYDENGRLATMSVDGVVLEAKDNFRYVEDYEDAGDKEHGELNWRIQNNHITSMSLTYTATWKEDVYVTENESMAVDFNYNAKGQLASWSMQLSSSETAGSERYSESASVSVALRYDNRNRLVDCTINATLVDDDGKHNATMSYGLNYDEGWPNKFYQYTPGLCTIALIEGSEFELFAMPAFAGLFGKASSWIPSSADLAVRDGSGETYHDSYDVYVVLNADGTVRRADYADYFYLTLDQTRAASALPVARPESGKRMLVRETMNKVSDRIRSVLQ